MSKMNAYIRKRVSVEKETLLEVGESVQFTIDGRKLALNFELFSIYREQDESLVYMFITKATGIVIFYNIPSNTDFDKRISAKLIQSSAPKEINITKIVVVHKADSVVSVDENKGLVYTRHSSVVGEVPVSVGDTFSSARRTFKVEYIANDGTLVCVVDDEAMALVTHKDGILLKSIGDIVWKSE